MTEQAKICPDPLCDHVLDCEHCDWCWDPTDGKPRTIYTCGVMW